MTANQRRPLTWKIGPDTAEIPPGGRVLALTDNDEPTVWAQINPPTTRAEYDFMLLMLIEDLALRLAKLEQPETRDPIDRNWHQITVLKLTVLEEWLQQQET